jgi:hypothetical protein
MFVAAKLTSRLVHCKDSNLELLGQLESCLNAEAGLCHRLLSEPQLRLDCLAWVNRLLDAGRGLELAEREVVPALSELLSAKDRIVLERTCVAVCLLRQMRSTVLDKTLPLLHDELRTCLNKLPVGGRLKEAISSAVTTE